MAWITPEARASLLSRVLFYYVNPLIDRANRAPLSMDDVWLLQHTDSAQATFERFKLNRRPGRHLAFVLIWVGLTPLVVTLAGGAATAILGFARPYYVNQILQWLQQDPKLRDPTDGLLIFLAMLAAGCTFGLVMGMQLFYGRRVGLQVSATLMAAIYAKALRRPVGVVEAAQLKNKDASANNAGDSAFSATSGPEVRT
ncbi:hypothetical protein HK405_000087, partial [Cladochytrium tenue]